MNCTAASISSAWLGAGSTATLSAWIAPWRLVRVVVVMVLDILEWRAMARSSGGDRAHQARPCSTKSAMAYNCPALACAAAGSLRSNDAVCQPAAGIISGNTNATKMVMNNIAALPFPLPFIAGYGRRPVPHRLRA